MEKVHCELQIRWIKIQSITAAELHIEHVSRSRRSKTSTKSRVHTWVKLDHAVDCSSQPLIGDVIASQRVSRPAVDIKF